jgi:hypothetical protein
MMKNSVKVSAVGISKLDAGSYVPVGGGTALRNNVMIVFGTSY